MVVAIMKDVSSALKYLHHMDPPILDKVLTSYGVMLNADYCAQLVHLHYSDVRPCCSPCVMTCKLLAQGCHVECWPIQSLCMRVLLLMADVLACMSWHARFCPVEGAFHHVCVLLLPFAATLHFCFHTCVLCSVLWYVSQMRSTYLYGLKWRAGRPTSHCATCCKPCALPAALIY